SMHCPTPVSTLFPYTTLFRSGFEITGFPFNGTFAEYITIPQENAVAKPEHLNWEEAGVLALSAMTAYRTMFTRGQLKAGQTVLIDRKSTRLNSSHVSISYAVF